MKQLEMVQMEDLQGGAKSVAGCVGSVMGVIAGGVSLGLLIAAPPVGLALGMGLAFLEGTALGASLAGGYLSC